MTNTLKVRVYLQARSSQANACKAELYAKKGGLTGRQFFPRESLHEIGVLTTLYLETDTLIMCRLR